MQEWRFRPITERIRLHTAACGDFTLLDRDAWFRVHGYPEFEMYSFHIDSLLCYAAYHSGITEQVLANPMVIYHIEHALGSGWTPDGHDALKKRLEGAGVPQLSDEQLYAWAVQMRRERRPILFNAENWGLVAENLPEIHIS